MSELHVAVEYYNQSPIQYWGRGPNIGRMAGVERQMSAAAMGQG
ncbi:MAG: hypothetical protein ACP5O7_05180 [Phycisphaerae bacterium]